MPPRVAGPLGLAPLGIGASRRWADPPVGLIPAPGGMYPRRGPEPFRGGPMTPSGVSAARTGPAARVLNL